MRPEAVMDGEMPTYVSLEVVLSYSIRKLACVQPSSARSETLVSELQCLYQ